MKCVVFSEDARSALELVSVAKHLGADDIVAVQFDAESAEVVAKSGVDGVVVAKVAAGALRESAASVVAAEARKAESAVVLVSASRRMVNAAAIVAGELGTVPIVDVKAIADGAASHIKFGGKAIVSEKPVGDYVVLVVASGTFEAAAADGAPCAISGVDAPGIHGAHVVERREKTASSVDLTAAKRIVCIGRGVDTREGFDLCVDLKKAIGAEMGCTRPVAETNEPLMPRETYIGASGVTVKPELFIGVAASGQAQHTMGMYESGTVVVIDKNKDALFFNSCDYGIVGDYAEIVPAITKALNA